MQITETCSCGNEFNYDDENPANTMVPSAIQLLLNDFRNNHKCKNTPATPEPF